MPQVIDVGNTTDLDQLHLQVSHFYARQMQALDDGRVEEWAATFTDDGVFAATGQPQAVTGRSAIASAAGRVRAGLDEAGVVHRHWIGMLTVEPVAPTSATEPPTVLARSYALVVATPRGGEPTLHRSTTCTDVLVMTDAGPLVRDRRVTRDDLA